MKKILLIAIALCAALSVSAFCLFTVSAHSKSLRGSSTIVTRTIDIPQFDKINVSRAVKVVITDNPSNKITITANDNLIDLVVVEAIKGELKITLDQKNISIQKANVTVTIPATANNAIRSLEASSASSINSTVVLSASEFAIETSSAATISVAVKAAKCKINASSASTIKAAIDADLCKIDASSASKIELTGSAKMCDADLSSASKLAANSFVVETYLIQASSASSATINCSVKLTASASSAANINYMGDANKISVSKSSRGNVQRK